MLLSFYLAVLRFRTKKFYFTFHVISIAFSEVHVLQNFSIKSMFYRFSQSSPCFTDFFLSPVHVFQIFFSVQSMFYRFVPQSSPCFTDFLSPVHVLQRFGSPQSSPVHFAWKYVNKYSNHYSIADWIKETKDTPYIENIHRKPVRSSRFFKMASRSGLAGKVSEKTTIKSHFFHILNALKASNAWLGFK